MLVSLSLFGAPTISRGSELVALPFERRSQLLVFLALRRSWVGRAELAALLWPDQDHKLALTNLRKALHRLQASPWAERMEAQGGSLRFDVTTDVAAFETALREHRVAEALGLRQGELLAGFDDGSNDTWSSWLSFERDRLRLAWRAAAQEHLKGELDAAEGIDLAARLVEDDPLDDSALRVYMEWLVRAGQGARARQAYRDFATRVSEELGLAPSAELKAFHDSIGAAGTPMAGAAPRAPVIPNDGFVGRTVEMRRIASLLSQDDCRLLCVVGPGGMGKTRLARRVIDELAVRFADGATFVPLEDVASAKDIAAQLAGELQVPLRGSAEPLAQVIGFLRGREALLALDNFEHLTAGASILDRLLEACPRLKILVTSRIRLALAAEWLLPLEGLPYPEAEDQDHIESFDAARLFVRAARRVQPALDPAAEAAAIVDICRQVEGLPLALELAAAWTRVLSCEAIAQELRGGTELLHAVDQAQPSRHGSIEVVFDQSWRLLSAIEREALARLSVFRGGFSAEAARAVAKAALPVLGALIDKSLLRKEEARLHLHPLVQQMAAARLGDGPERAASRAAHAAYFHRMLVQLRPSAEAGDRTALQTIDVDFENCRRAWAWSIAEGPVDVLRLSTKTLLEYCDHRGRFGDGLLLLRAATESPAVQKDEKLHALLLAQISHLEYRLDRYADAEAAALRALAMGGRGRDYGAKVQALNVLATCALRLGRLDDARRYFKQALDDSAPESQPGALAGTLDHLALVEKALGNYDEALKLSLQSLAQYRALGDYAEEAMCLNNLGALCLVRNEDEAAAGHLRQALAICDSHGIVSTSGFVLSNLTELALRAGDLGAAKSASDRALAVAGTTGNRAVMSWVKTKVARLKARGGDLAGARAVLAEAFGSALDVGMFSLKFDAVVALAEILAAQGEVECQRGILGYVADHAAANEMTRDFTRAQLAKLPATKKAVAAPAFELDELLRRALAETGVAYAPLISLLNSGR